MNPSASGRLFARSHWSTLGRDLLAAAIVSLAALSAYVSAASLLFQGPLLPHLPVAVGAALLGGAGISLWAALRGSMPLASVGLLPSNVSVMGTIAAGVAAESTASSAMPSAVMALAITTTLIGLAWWLMGRQRWGDVVRYVPFPVVGGFMASAFLRRRTKLFRDEDTPTSTES